MNKLQDNISLDVETLDGLFRFRVKQSPQAVAYHQFNPIAHSWRAWRWSEVADEVSCWVNAFQRDGLCLGDRVAVMLPNSIEWVVFDQSALSLGLVTVPLFNEDNEQNCAHILRESSVRIIVVGNLRQLAKIKSVLDTLPSLEKIVCVETLKDKAKDKNIVALQDWLPKEGVPETTMLSKHTGGDMATIVYTSGTTGPPKGVMLTHANILKNAQASSQVADIIKEDRLVSFLPLSHMFERTAGYYLAMLVGAEVAFARSVLSLIEDIEKFKPTVLISVPRIYEQVLDKLEVKLRRSLWAYGLFKLTVAVGRHRAHVPLYQLIWPVLDCVMASRIRKIFGGRLRYAISGGAPMSPAITHTFLALGVPICQGYGLTETGPVISVNRLNDNVPKSVGAPLPGVEIAIGDEGELLTRSEYVMQGYWKHHDATQKAIDNAGWLHTGDKAKIDDAGRIYIVGRIKEIIVMANGEKVPPVDVEQALLADPMVLQVMVYGEARPFLIALVVVDSEKISTQKDLEYATKNLKQRSVKLLNQFPSYTRVRRFILINEPWSIDNGMLTPTLKMKRSVIADCYREQIKQAYHFLR